MYNLKILEEGCDILGVELKEEQKDQFIKYYEMLVEKNKHVNLTSITEWDDVLKKHFVDSLAIVKALNLDNISNIIDIGTGGGFPGIPLKIAFPHIDVTLLDSLQKRINFLEDVGQQLQLENVEAIHGRAEDIAKNKKYREKYDICVSRAVANLATLSEYCIPFVKEGGAFVAYKSGKVQDEVQQASKAIETLGGKIENIVYFNIPDTDMERSLVVIRKNKKTPSKYPRKAGMPTKEPIV